MSRDHTSMAGAAGQTSLVFLARGGVGAWVVFTPGHRSPPRWPLLAMVPPSWLPSKTPG